MKAMNIGRDLVLKKIKEIFPQENPEGVMAILDLHGVESYERERERVQLAILKLCNGRVDELVSNVEMAKQDYRDVLAYAEYPSEMRRSASDMQRMSLGEAQGIRSKDRQQYLEWLNGSEQEDEGAT
jgi:hypothetical protein